MDARRPGSARQRGALFAAVLVAYLVLAVFFAFTLVNHDYESEYLALGDLVVRGEISLYQDEMRGQWVPLPFYVYGVAQILHGRSLFAARLLSVGVGAIVLGLVFVLADRWRGPLAAATACALVATHGLVTGYLSTVHFAGITAALHLLGIYVLFGTDGPRRDDRARGMAGGRCPLRRAPGRGRGLLPPSQALPAHPGADGRAARRAVHPDRRGRGRRGRWDPRVPPAWSIMLTRESSRDR